MKTYEVLLTPYQLALRWGCSVKKLDADRLRDTGCPYVKIGRLVRYRAIDVEARSAIMSGYTAEAERELARVKQQGR